MVRSTASGQPVADGQEQTACWRRCCRHRWALQTMMPLSGGTRCRCGRNRSTGDGETSGKAAQQSASGPVDERRTARRRAAGLGRIQRLVGKAISASLRVWNASRSQSSTSNTAIFTHVPPCGPGAQASGHLCRCTTCPWMIISGTGAADRDSRRGNWRTCRSRRRSPERSAVSGEIVRIGTGLAPGGQPRQGSSRRSGSPDGGGWRRHDDRPVAAPRAPRAASGSPPAVVVGHLRVGHVRAVHHGGVHAPSLPGRARPGARARRQLGETARASISRHSCPGLRRSARLSMVATAEAPRPRLLHGAA